MRNQPRDIRELTEWIDQTVFSVATKPVFSYLKKIKELTTAGQEQYNGDAVSRFSNMLRHDQIGLRCSANI